MKKFKFRFQSLLEAREKVLKDCQLELARIQSKLNEQQQYLEYLYQKLDINKNNLEALLKSFSGIDFNLIKSYQLYMIKLQDDIKNQHKVISDTEVELEESKNKILEALKAKTIIEKLKEKEFELFKTQIEKQDLEEIDEIATNRHKSRT